MKKLITVLVTALLLAACTGDNGEPGPTETTTTTPTTSPTTVPTESPTTAVTTTPEPSPEEAAAKQAVIAFWEVQDELAANPDLSVTRLTEVARGQALEVHRTNLLDQAREGLRQVGTVEVTPTSVQAGEAPEHVVVTACLDVSDVDIVNSAGDSVVPATRPDRAAYDYTVEQDGDRWYVIEDLVEAKAC